MNVDALSPANTIVRLTNFASIFGRYVDVGADWSPDGRKIAVPIRYSAFPTDRSDLWLIDLTNPNNCRELFINTVNKSYVGNVAWSPDGRYIAFLSSKLMVLRMDVPNSLPQVLFDAQAAGMDEFTWSPDGSHLLYRGPGNTVRKLVINYVNSNPAQGIQSAIVDPFLIQLPIENATSYNRLRYAPSGQYFSITKVSCPNVNCNSSVIIYQPMSNATPKTYIYGRFSEAWTPDSRYMLFDTGGVLQACPVIIPYPTTYPGCTPLGNVASTDSRPQWRKAWDTYGIFRNSEARFYLRHSLSSGPADTTLYFGDPARTYSPVMGDWNGDSVDTVGLYDSVSTQFFLRNSNTTGFADYALVFGAPGDTPLAGRWTANANHDGIGVFRPSNGVLYLKNELTSGFSDYAMVLGNPGDAGVAGDWNRDGIDSIGVYRPDLSRFYLANSVTNGIVYADLTIDYGDGSQDKPVTGDWVRLGNTRIGVYRNGTFRLRDDLSAGAENYIAQFSLAGADAGTPLGDASDKPVVGHFVPVYSGQLTALPNPPCVVQLGPNAKPAAYKDSTWLLLNPADRPAPDVLLPLTATSPATLPVYRRLYAPTQPYAPDAVKIVQVFYNGDYYWFDSSTGVSGVPPVGCNLPAPSTPTPVSVTSVPRTSVPTVVYPWSRPAFSFFPLGDIQNTTVPNAMSVDVRNSLLGTNGRGCRLFAKYSSDYTSTAGLHPGFDFYVPVGSPVYAADYGVVIGISGIRFRGSKLANQPNSMAPEDAESNMRVGVIIRHGYSMMIYEHLGGTYVGVGATVSPGQPIGWVGPYPELPASGTVQTPFPAFGPHLHFEVLTYVPGDNQSWPTLMAAHMTPNGVFQESIYPAVKPSTRLNLTTYFPSQSQTALDRCVELAYTSKFYTSFSIGRPNGPPSTPVVAPTNQNTFCFYPRYSGGVLTFPTVTGPSISTCDQPPLLAPTP
jgi:murein DD-endopeptidase MepM/ murein hydrolase activator NlpD